jgi:hypothetical protein
VCLCLCVRFVCVLSRIVWGRALFERSRVGAASASTAQTASSRRTLDRPAAQTSILQLYMETTPAAHALFIGCVCVCVCARAKQNKQKTKPPAAAAEALY